MGITDLGAESAQESQANSSDGDQYESDYERYQFLDGDAFGMQHPTTAIRGTVIATRKLYDENDPDRADIAIMLDDPSLVTSEAALSGGIVVESDDESDDFKVVDTSDRATAILGPGGKFDHFAIDGDTVQVFESTEVLVDADTGELIEGEPDEETETETEERVVTDDGDPVVDKEFDVSDAMGIDFSGNTFYGSIATDFESDRIALKRGGGAGRSITTTLDVKGATSARTVEDDDGNIVLHDGGFPQHNGGLVEYHPDGRDGERPRWARDPELRPDVDGNEVVIMIQRLDEVDPDYNGNAYWATVFANLDDDRMQELAEQYADESDGKSADDFLTDLDGDTFLKLQPTDEFEPMDDLLRDTGYIAWNRPSTEAVNEARVANGFEEYDFGDDTEDDVEAEAE